jgi:hypothetical protein
VPFSLLALLGARSDERTRTPLGAHQSVRLSQVKENTAFDRTDLRFLYYTEISHEYIVIKSFEHHRIINYLRPFTPIIATLPTITKNRKQGNF